LLAGLAGAVFGPRQVWLTFDDGPDPVKIGIILDCLSARNIRAVLRHRETGLGISGFWREFWRWGTGLAAVPTAMWT